VTDWQQERIEAGQAVVTALDALEDEGVQEAVTNLRTATTAAVGALESAGVHPVDARLAANGVVLGAFLREVGEGRG
jgi:hypothetical protein